MSRRSVVCLLFADDSAGTPGRCMRAKNLSPCTTQQQTRRRSVAKNLSPCTTLADCSDPGDTCSSLTDSPADQRYCLPTSSSRADAANELQQMLQMKAPGKHQAFAKQLAPYGTLIC